MKLCLLNLSARLFLLLLVCISNSSFSQTLPTDYFKSRATGNWTSASTWSSSHDNETWENATIAPNQESSGITINSGHIVTITTYIYIDQVKINSGGTLVNTYRFSLMNGPGIDLDVEGTLDVKYYIATSAEIVMRNGSRYNKYLLNDTQVNKCTWETGSTLNVVIHSSTNVINVMGLDQHFYTVIIDGTIQAGIVNLNLKPTTQIDGDFNFLNSHAKEIWLTSSTTPINLNILGDLNLTKTILLYNSTPTSITANNVNIGEQSDLAINNQDNELIILGNLNLTATGQINKSPHANGTIFFAGNQNIQSVTNLGSIRNVNYVINPSAAVSFNSMTLASPYTLTLENNSSLLLSTPNIPATIKRIIPPADWTQSMDGWHLLSSPVINQSLATGGFTQAEYDFYAWNEVQNEWLNQKIAANNITAFVPGEGYLVSYLEGGTKTFTGNLNTASLNFTNLSFTGTSPAAGFHLLGNPFPCSLDWNAAGWNRNGFSSVAQVWNDEAGNYLPLTPDGGIIPPEQGFFVQALSGSNSITIPTQARVHSNVPFNKQLPANLIRLRISDTVSGMFDETVVMLSADASVGYDEFDGHKLVGSSNAPQLFTEITAGERACVNALPTGSPPSALPLFFSKGVGDYYLLEVVCNSMENEVWLEDKLTGSVTLLDGSPISIDATAAFPENRFVLHLVSLGIDESAEKDHHIYSYSNTLYFTNITSTTEYGVFCLDGKMAVSGNLQPYKLNSVDCSTLKPGVYIVRLNTGNATRCEKILIY